MTPQSLPRLLAGLLAAAFIVLAGTAGAAPAIAPAAVDSVSAASSVPEPQRLAQRVSEEFLSKMQFLSEEEAAAIAPVSTDYNLIRPGQAILVTIPGEGTFICSLSFLFKDNKNPVNYYASTAGHCVLPSWGVSTHGAGANYNPSGVSVSVCVSNCHFGGQLTGLGATMVSLGSVTYARQTQTTAAVGCTAGDIGNDFGLIKINPTWYTSFSWVKPNMAVWSGPYVFGLGVEGTGLPLVHHGNGITWGSAEPTKARAGVSLNDGILCSFQALINVAGGDSGSSISIAGTSPELVVSGTEALGTITHGIVYAGTPAFGTTVYRGMQMASTDAGLTISLCKASATLAFPASC